MSESENKENSETKSTVIPTNVALVVAERDHAIELVTKLTDEKELLQKELDAANARINEDTKAALINEIAPMTRTSRDMLALKTVDELILYKKVLGQAQIPAFKSGTPIVPANKSPEAKLASAFDEYADKTWRKN